MCVSTQVQEHCSIAPLLLLSEDPTFPSLAAPSLHCLARPISQSVQTRTWPALRNLLILLYRSLSEATEDHTLLLPDVTSLCTSLLQVFPIGPQNKLDTHPCSPAPDACEVMALSAACINRLLCSASTASPMWMSQNISVLGSLIQSLRHISPHSLHIEVSGLPHVPTAACSAAFAALHVLHVHERSLHAAARALLGTTRCTSGPGCPAEQPEALPLQLLHVLFDMSDILCFSAELLDAQPHDALAAACEASGTTCTNALAASAVDLVLDVAQQESRKGIPATSENMALLESLPFSDISSFLGRWLQLGAISAACR